MAVFPAGALGLKNTIYSDNELLFAIPAVKNADLIGDSMGVLLLTLLSYCPSAKLYAVYRKKFDFDQKHYKT